MTMRIPFSLLKALSSVVSHSHEASSEHRLCVADHEKIHISVIVLYYVPPALLGLA